MSRERELLQKIIDSCADAQARFHIPTNLFCEALDIFENSAVEPEPLAYCFLQLDDSGDVERRLGFTVPESGFDVIPLYRSPPAQSRRPLSNAEIDSIWDSTPGFKDELIDNFARAIERAHGITED